MENTQKENPIPIYLKYAISVEEAGELTGIGTKTLYRLIRANRDADWLLHVGDRKTLFKRKAFMEYPDRVSDL